MSTEEATPVVVEVEKKEEAVVEAPAAAEEDASNSSVKDETSRDANDERSLTSPEGGEGEDSKQGGESEATEEADGEAKEEEAGEEAAVNGEEKTNGHAKDTNGNVRKRESEEVSEDTAEGAEGDAPALKKKKADDEVETVEEAAPAVAAE